MKYFEEIDVTDMGRVHILHMYDIILNGGWGRYIDNLEMILDDNENIIIRGWATKPRWEQFYEVVIRNRDWDRSYERRFKSIKFRNEIIKKPD